MNDLERLGSAVKRAVVKGKPTDAEKMESVNLIEERLQAEVNLTVGHGLRYVREDRWAAAATGSATMARGWFTTSARMIMSGLFWERSWPYLAAVFATGLWYIFLEKPFPSDARPLIGATGTVSAVLVGFLVTAKTIVLGLTGSAVFKTLVQSGYHRIFYSYFFEAEAGGLCLLLISMVGFFAMDPDGGTTLLYAATWMLAAMVSLTLFVRVMFLLFSFLRQA
ncbi:hypothetical protein [Nitratireductor aquibiodomus]|nr:hypothetical protein [Nitratireductor aquibiodomus]